MSKTGSKGTYFDVYEGKSVVLKGVTAKEIAETFGISKSGVLINYKHGWKINRRYRLIRASKEPELTRIEKFKKEWDSICPKINTALNGHTIMLTYKI